jgi:hypothetical protein
MIQISQLEEIKINLPRIWERTHCCKIIISFSKNDLRRIDTGTEYKEIASLSHKEIKNFIVNEITENQQWARAANLYQLAGIWLLCWELSSLHALFHPSTSRGFALARGGYCFLLYYTNRFS